MSRIGCLVSLLCAALFCAACAGPEERPVPVGRQHRAFVDPQRTDWDFKGARPLAATIWYPAAVGSAEQPWEAGVFQFGRNAVDAAFYDEQPRPLIVLSHGTGGSAAQLSWVAEQLVAAGFVVAAVSHHGNTAAEPSYRLHGFVLPWERARDLSVLIDRLLADTRIGPHIDAGKIGALGFSLGGYSVLATAGARLSFEDWQRNCDRNAADPGCALPPEAPFTLADVQAYAASNRAFRAGVERGHAPTRDPRIRAVFAIAPALLQHLDIASLQGIDLPVQVVLGEVDGQVPAASSARHLAQYLPGAQVETIPATGHYAFLAPCTLRGRVFLRELCHDEHGVDRNALHDQVGAAAARFFSQHLR